MNWQLLLSVASLASTEEQEMTLTVELAATSLLNIPL